ILVVAKPAVNYDEIQNWSAKITPGAGYLVTLRPVGSPAIFILGSGNADANGDAVGSFGVARNLPTGDIALRVELVSDPATFDEKLFAVSEITPSVAVTVANQQVNYGDTQGWEAAGLPPDAGYVITLRSLANPIVFVLGSGNADANGDARGSFGIGGNLPAGASAFRVELTSDPSIYDERFFMVGEITPSVAVTVANQQVNYGDTQGWEAAGLPPDAGYVITLRAVENPVVILLGSGNSNADGEASGSFGIGDNIPAGEYALHIELESLPPYFGEATFNVG
ncbi:MAG: hypothetical protein ACRD38_12705, partial [Nitrososphaerales archaeon]